MFMGIRLVWWALGAAASILIGAVWATLSNPAVFPAGRAALLTVGHWLEAHNGAVTTLATIVIAAFTVTLACSIYRLWQATHRDFLSTHRPRIIIHSSGYCSEGRGVIGAIFTYVNAGVAPATITEIGSKIFLTTREGPRPGGDDPMSVEQIYDKKLKGGEQAMHTVSSDVRHNDIVVQEMRDERGFPSVSAFCIGYIAYVDDLGVGRKTGFCRRYESSTRSWCRVENSDYEYAY
jgi:hypothetical protein